MIVPRALAAMFFASSLLWSPLGRGAPAAPQAKPALVSVGAQAIRLLAEDGALLISIPASLPDPSLLHSQGRLYILSGKELHVLDLPKKTLRSLGELPLPPCPEASLASLAPQSPADMGLTPDGKALCVRLMDRNENMMSLAVESRIPLSGEGKGRAALVEDREGVCKIPPQKQGPCPRRSRRSAFPPPRKSLDGLELTTDPCALRTPRGKVVPFVADSRCEPSLEGLTPSARFALVSLPLGSNDYIWRRLHVVDLLEGKVLKGLSRNIVGESRIEWAPDRDDVLVDDHLLRLGQTSRAIPLEAPCLMVR